MPSFKGHGLTVEVGPFLNPITVKTLDTTGYEGCPGGIIAVYPTDNAELERVLVAIRGEETGLIERGNARWNSETQRWEYVTEGDLPTRGQVTVEVLGVASSGQHSASLRVNCKARYVFVECRSAGEVHCMELCITGRRGKRRRTAQMPPAEPANAAPMPETVAAAA